MPRRLLPGPVTHRQTVTPSPLGEAPRRPRVPPEAQAAPTGSLDGTCGGRVTQLQGVEEDLCHLLPGDEGQLRRAGAASEGSPRPPLLEAAGCKGRGRGGGAGVGGRGSPPSDRPAATRAGRRNGSSRAACPPGWAAGQRSRPGAEIQPSETAAGGGQCQSERLPAEHRMLGGGGDTHSPASVPPFPLNSKDLLVLPGGSRLDPPPKTRGPPAGAPTPPAPRGPPTWHRTSGGRCMRPSTLRSYQGSSMPR